MASKRVPVMFNESDKKRYLDLGIKTPFHKKVKQLLNDFLEKMELKKKKKKIKQLIIGNKLIY